MRRKKRPSPLATIAVCTVLATGTAEAADVLSADDIAELTPPAAPDRSFISVPLPWLDPDSPLTDPSFAPLLYYQLGSDPGPLLARRLGATVEIAIGAPGCGTGGSGGPVGSVRDLSMTILGTSRRYHRHVPADYDPAKPYPLLIFYHGRGGSADIAMDNYAMVPLADANDFIVLFPESLTLPDCGVAVGGKHWDVCDDPPDPDTSQDVLFTSRLIEETMALYNVCTKRIVTHGHSYGARFSYYVAVTLPDTIAAFAEHSGGLTIFGVDLCFPRCFPAGIRPIPGALIHSTDDTSVLYSNSVTLDDEMTRRGHETWFTTLIGFGHRFDTSRNQATWDWLMDHPLP